MLGQVVWGVELSQYLSKHSIDFFSLISPQKHVISTYWNGHTKVISLIVWFRDVRGEFKIFLARLYEVQGGRPRWLSWMRRPTGDQEVAGSTPAEVGNILSWRLIMKYFLRSFSPFRWFKKGSCQFLAKECAQY